MKPAPFVYDSPSTVDEAVALLHQHGDEAKVLAGGQSLLPLLALRLARPERVVDIGRIDALRSVDATDDGVVRIGAGVTHRRAERDAVLSTRNPLLAAALPHIAHVPIRTRGTVCGSLAHADPAAELPAVALALDAVLVARRASGERRIAAGEFFVSYLETALEPDELLTGIELPAWPARAGWSFHEVARRPGDFALAGVAVRLATSSGAVVDARVACFGVAATPVRLATIEAAALGPMPPDGDASAAHARELAALVRDAVDPPGDVHATGAYRRHVTGVLVARAVQEALVRARTADGVA